MSEAERMLDFSEENLEMCSCIAKAQAQHCAFEKVIRTPPVNVVILSQLAMQASELYSKAYAQVLVLTNVDGVNLKNFACTVNYNTHSFQAKANYWMAQRYIMNIGQSPANIAKAIAYLTKACDALEQLKKSPLSPRLNSMHASLVKKYSGQLAQLVKANNEVYRQAFVESVDKIECLQFTEAFSLQEELGRPFEGREIFAKMIPPEIQRLEEDYRRYIEDLIGSAQQWICIADREYDGFMKSHNLPESLYATPGEQKLPEDLLAKVQECRERGGVKLLKYSFEEMASAISSAELRLDSLQSQLECEAEEDEEFRKQYGSKCSFASSHKLNEEKWRALTNLGHRLRSIKDIAERARKVMEDESIRVIELDKEGMQAKLPKSSCIEKQLASVVEKYLLP